MTKKQREAHINDIRNTLIEHCGAADRWGHYKIKNYRFKMQKTSMRLEVKSGNRWHKVGGDYFKNLDVESLRDQLVNIDSRN